MSAVTFEDEREHTELQVDTTDRDEDLPSAYPLHRLSTLTHGADPFGSRINDEINFQREKWDRFAYGIINKLDAAISREIDPLPVQCKKMKAATYSKSGITPLEGMHNAIFIKGGAGYYAYDDVDDASSPLLSNGAPRTHDYDFTICCTSLSGIREQVIADFFWVAIREHEKDLDLQHLSNFARIDRTQARTEYHHKKEETILTGPHPSSPAERCDGGPSDYLTLTTFTSPAEVYTNYRINAFLQNRQTGKFSVHHIVEFIFTILSTESDHAKVIYRIARGPHYTIPVLDIISLLKYSIFAMAKRGLDHRKWRKARQDYARIIKFIDIAKGRHSLKGIINSKAWNHVVEIFNFLSESLPHCIEDGFTSIESGDLFFDENFTCVDAKNLIWYVLNEIDFVSESKPYEVTECFAPMVLDAKSNTCSKRFHLCKTNRFWVITSIYDHSVFESTASSYYDFY